MRFLIIAHKVSGLQINYFSDNSVTIFKEGKPEALRCFSSKEAALTFIDHLIYLEDLWSLNID